MQIVTLCLFRFASPSTRMWALGMMGAARLSMPRIPGIGFWKLCGSGSGEGFTPMPNTAVYGIFATWPDHETALRGLQARVFDRYRNRATENWTLMMSPMQATGRWTGQTPFEAQEDTGTGPLVALTRATIRPAKALRFWNRVPDISAMIGANPDVLFKIGLGEVPLLHQITFSIWPDAQSMARFARHDGPHASAIAAVRDGDWFREELYARFRVIETQGSWRDAQPFAPTGRAA